MIGLPRRTARVAGRAIIACDAAREAISAQFDGEPYAMSATLLAEHVMSCEACGRFHSELTGLSRRARLRAQRPAPDGLAAQMALLLPAGPVSAQHGSAHPDAIATDAGHGPSGRQHRRDRHRLARSAMAVAPGVAAMIVLAAGGVGAHPHLSPHLVSNGCISSLLRHHVWPGY